MSTEPHLSPRSRTSWPRRGRSRPIRPSPPRPTPGRRSTRRRSGLRGVLGEARPRAAPLDRAVRDDPRVGPAVRQVVPRRPAERRLELPRPARRERPRRQGRLPLDRRAGRHADDHLRRPAARGQQGRQRPQGARHRDRRPGRHLHADDPRAADRDAGLRPARRAPHGRLRRLLRRGPVRPDQRRPGQARDHGRRRLAARQARRASSSTSTRPSSPPPRSRPRRASAGDAATTSR